MKNIKKDQHGIAHILLLTVVVVGISLIGYTWYRVASSKNRSQTNTSNSDTTQKLETPTAGEEETLQTEQPTPTDNQSTPSTISFNKGGGSLEGENVNLSATTSNPQTGTCTYTLTLGNSKVQKSNTITNSRTCAISIPLSAFPKNGDWYFSLSFASKDGKITGKGGDHTVSVNPQPRVISFTKGGGGQNGDTVDVSGTMAEAHSGTCTYKFSLNGTVRVEKTTSITNSQTCSASIPVSDFPKSAIYSFSMSFTSSNGLVTAAQAPYDIDVM